MQETAESIKAKSTALRLIARAEQCSAGLTRKLEKRGFDSTCVSGVISGLCESNLIDDNRFARFWLQSRLHFTRSPRQLLSSLCARGIDRDDAQDALKSVLDEDAELSLMERYVKKLSRKKSRKNNGGDPSRSIKQILKNEGFSYDVINRFLGEE